MKNINCAFVRVVQSNNGWTKPCGLDYGHGAHFASDSGFGFEEWMNSDHPMLQTDTHRFIHIEAIRQGFNPAKHGYYRLILWMYNPVTQKKYIVGHIENYQLATIEEIAHISASIEQKPLPFHEDLINLSHNINSANSIKIFNNKIADNLKINKKHKVNLKVLNNGIKVLSNFKELPESFKYNYFKAYINYPDTLNKLILESYEK